MPIAIRNIQHYIYCPRRFALLEIEQDWAENVFVVRANLMHKSVHSGEHDIHSKTKTEISNVWIYNDELDIYGVADCIEFRRNKSGVYIDELSDRFNVSVVEYKPTKPKNNNISESDAIQVFAQKLCVDYIWKCNSKAYLYYSDVKKRVCLPFDEEYDKYYDMLIESIEGMNKIYETGEIPVRRTGKKCGGCSLENICIPIKKKHLKLQDEIENMIGG